MVVGERMVEEVTNGIECMYCTVNKSRSDPHTCQLLMMAYWLKHEGQEQEV